MTLLPLESMPRDNVRGVLTDIDDTLTTHGRLTAEAYAALERLHDAGMLVIPITGRPGGWCDHIARMWPVAGVVGENGALWMRHDNAAQRLIRRFDGSEDEREKNRARVAAVGARILDEVRGCALASDQHYRETDLAIDFCEDVPRLPPEDVDRIVAIMQQHGMTAKVSSIHVNGWFGHYDKLAMTRTLLREAFSIDLDAEADRFVFAGDSPNDAPMFGYFARSVGVANVREQLARIATPPAYVTQRARGAGFAELADYLLG